MRMPWSPYRWQRMYRLCWLLGLLGVLWACSSDKPKEIKPNPLPKLSKTQERLTRLWSFHIGHGNQKQFLLLRPAVTASRVFAVSADGVLEAHERLHGKRLWRIHCPTSVSVGVEAGYGQVVVGTTDGRVISYRIQDGHQLWSTMLGSTPMSEPLLSAALVYVSANDGTLYALDRQTGKQRWTAETSVPRLSLRGMSKPLLLNDLLIVGTGDGRVQAFKSDSGDPVWESRVMDSQGRTELERMNDVDADMVADADTLYVASYHGGLAAMDQDTGKHRWENTASSWQGLALGLGSVYIVYEDSTIEDWDASSGKSAWKQADLRGRRISAPVFLDHFLVVGDFKGWVHVLSVEDGHWLGREHFFRTGGFLAPPQASGNEVFLQSVDGRVIALRLEAKG